MSSNVDRVADTERFYALMEQLSSQHGGPRLLSEVRGTGGWPSHGVYFFFEPGEQRGDGAARVVRVGTHALRPNSKATLWKRLSQHRGSVAGHNPGGGNHRGSIFRLHVGAALINRGDVTELPLSGWLAAKPSPEYREAELAVERAVSQYIGRMPVLWLDVPTREDGTSDRGLIESSSIALLSTLVGGIDVASDEWLGNYAANAAVRNSGLWNVRHVTDAYQRTTLDVLEQYVSHR